MFTHSVFLKFKSDVRDRFGALMPTLSKGELTSGAWLGLDLGGQGDRSTGCEDGGGCMNQESGSSEKLRGVRKQKGSTPASWGTTPPTL